MFQCIGFLYCVMTIWFPYPDTTWFTIWTNVHRLFTDRRLNGNSVNELIHTHTYTHWLRIPKMFLIELGLEWLEGH